MLFTAPRSHGNKPLGSQLRPLLDDPLHAVELEDREQKGYRKCRLRFYLRDQREPHGVPTDTGDDGTPHAITRDHVTLHAGLRTQHANQVSRLLSLERSAAVVPVVGNPPPSRHRSTVSSESVMAQYHFGKRCTRFPRVPVATGTRCPLTSPSRLIFSPVFAGRERAHPGGVKPGRIQQGKLATRWCD